MNMSKTLRDRIKYLPGPDGFKLSGSEFVFVGAAKTVADTVSCAGSIGVI